MKMKNEDAKNVERIVFQFSRKEISALLKLMSIPGLAGLTVGPEQPDAATTRNMVEGGIVMPCGDRTFVDATISLLLMTAGQSRRHLAARSESGRATLFRGEKLCVLIEEKGWGALRIEPVPDMEAAQASWRRALQALGDAFELTLTDGEATLTRTDGVQAMEEMYLQLKQQ